MAPVRDGVPAPRSGSRPSDRAADFDQLYQAHYGRVLAMAYALTGDVQDAQDLCQEAKTASLDKVVQEGNLVLTAKGLRGTDYDCGFAQVLKAPNAKGWIATAFCHESSGDFPDLLSISQADDGSLSVVSVYGNSTETGEDDSGDGF